MKKIALCIGINAYGGGNSLSGCVNDALDWSEALRARGYEVSTMLDGDATMARIIDAITALMKRSRYRDRIVITYSGHGTYGQDASGDESDHHDEAICPVDCFQVGMLYDDEIGALMSRRAFGSRLLWVPDSCFSGTVNRFYGPTTKGKPRLLPPHLMPPREKTVTARAAGSPALLLSGCSDTEYSYDTSFKGRPNGAFSRVALDALQRNPKSYKQWHQFIREVLPSDDYPQSPKLDGSLYRRLQGVL
jgi:hypothetical protein